MLEGTDMFHVVCFDCGISACGLDHIEQVQDYEKPMCGDCNTLGSEWVIAHITNHLTIDKETH